MPHRYTTHTSQIPQEHLLSTAATTLTNSRKPTIATTPNATPKILVKEYTTPPKYFNNSTINLLTKPEDGVTCSIKPHLPKPITLLTTFWPVQSLVTIPVTQAQ